MDNQSLELRRSADSVLNQCNWALKFAVSYFELEARFREKKILQNWVYYSVARFF
jgi:hypothetical protein